MILVFFGVFVVNIVFHYWNKRNLYKYLDSVPQLLVLNNVADSLHKDPTYRELAPELPDSIRILNQIKNRLSFFHLEVKLQNEMQIIFWAVLELFKVAFLLEPLLLFGVLKRLDSKREDIEKIFCFIGEIDMMVSIASLRAGLKDYCKPDVIIEPKISVTHIFHPLIMNCVPNDIDVFDKSVLLTGSNMSGKTSFIRTVGINVITGLTINTCFARDMSIPRLRIFSAIRISDDLLNSKSYYFEEEMAMGNKRDDNKAY